MNAQLLTVKYEGYDIKKGTFIFGLKSSKFHLYASEVSWNTPAPELVQKMKNNVDKIYQLLIYPTTYGYYVEFEKGRYFIYDGITGLKVSDAYSSLEDIPKTYYNRAVYKYKKRSIVGEIHAR